MHIWWFRDGRAGHERQARALIEALGRLRAVTTTERRPLGFGGLLRAAARRLHADAPDLLVGAGHDTHLSLLAARRALGGRAVVIMRPSLPVGWFDLCIAPRHDGLAGRDNVVETLGPMSPVRPAPNRDGPPMVLVGGPSRHYRWDDATVVEGIRDAMGALRQSGWLVATSRRTPASFVERARRELAGDAALRLAGEVPAGWLDEHLPRAALSLVTPDSLSMLFDCLAAGGPCGILELPAEPGSRVARVVDALVADGRLGRAAALAEGRKLPESEPPADADRAARHVLERWFS